MCHNHGKYVYIARQCAHLALMTDLGIMTRLLDAVYDRELTAADIAAGPQRQDAVQTPVIKRLRTQHHHLARLIAEGRKEIEVSALTGYSQSRISILKNDPAFAELIEHYKQEAAVAYVNVHERLAALGIASLDELQARLEEDPDKFSNKELRELAAMLFDRSVAPSKGVGGAAQTVNQTAIKIEFVQPAPAGAIVETKQITEKSDG